MGKLLVSSQTGGSFKRDVYRRVMKEFASVVMYCRKIRQNHKTHLLIDVKEVSHANYAHSPARNSRKGSQRTRLNEALNILVTDICLAMDTGSVRSTWPIMIDVVTT